MTTCWRGKLHSSPGRDAGRGGGRRLRPLHARGACSSFKIPLRLPSHAHQNLIIGLAIYLNVRHSQNPKPSWYGESVGHYEGDELVVDTIGLNDRSFVDNYRTPHTEQSHVVERFKMIEGGKTLQAVVTVDDPGAFNMSWTAVQRWRRVSDRPTNEMICPENNLNFFNFEVVPVPQAVKPDFLRENAHPRPELDSFSSNRHPPLSC